MKLAVNEAKGMKIDIQNALVDFDHTLEVDIQRRLMLALSKMKSHISSITFIIRDVVNKAGKQAKYCSLTITLKRLSDILIEEVQVDLDSAIDRVIQKATRLLSRKISSGRSENL